jgi:hypothetical protein
MKITDALARAIAQDRANERMRAGKRSTWNRADYNFAVKVFNELMEGK